MKMTQGKVTFSVMGLGGRASAYLSALQAYAPHAYQLVAVADPDPAKQARARSEYGLGEGQIFDTDLDMMAQPRLSDVAIIATQDKLHLRDIRGLLEKGYDLILEKPVATTLDELHTALKAFKDNDMSAKVYGNAPGSTIPMSTGFDEWCWGQNIFYAGFGFTNWPNDVCNDLVLQKDGKCRFVCAEDNYRKAVTYFHDWYAEGLMDVEMFSQDTNQLLAKGAQGYLGVSTWWYIEELMGDYSKDYVFLPVLDGPDGTHNVTVRTGGGTNSGNLNVTNKCQSPANLLKFFDQWYDGETVMQLQYGPIGVFFTEQDANGKWKSITEEEAKAKYNKGAGELKSTYEVWGPKLILSEYYDKYFYMEDRAIERLTDLKDFWMPFVDDTTTYPIDCVFTSEELDTIDRYRADFENAVSEQEGLWLKDGGPSDDEWSAYLDTLTNSCGMDKLLEVYQNAYDRYKANV